MPLEETLETFRYFLGEVDKLKPSYVALVRYSLQTDVVIDGELSLHLPIFLYLYLHPPFVFIQANPEQRSTLSLRATVPR